MNARKKELCQKLIMPFLQMCAVLSAVLFILFFVVSLFNQQEVPVSEVLLLSLFGGVIPVTIAVGLSIVINLIKGLRIIGEQEKFY